MSRLLYVFTTALLLVSTSALSVPSCLTVVNNITPCLNYLRGKNPTAKCCAGVKNLKDAMKTKADQVAVCTCTQDVLKGFTYDPKIIPALPKKCGVSLVLPPIDKNYDCKKLEVSSFRVLLEEDEGVSDS
ncbi:hypothetical protein ACS0TY_019610 [Phlomoides rotata]